MFYIVQVEHNEDDMKYHFSVGIVWGETKYEAYTKSQRLFANYDVVRFEIQPLDLEKIRVQATLGGMIIASFEDYYE